MYVLTKNKSSPQCTVLYFSTANQLLMHIIDDQEKPFECLDCGMELYKKSDFKQHEIWFITLICIQVYFRFDDYYAIWNIAIRVIR